MNSQKGLNTLYCNEPPIVFFFGRFTECGAPSAAEFAEIVAHSKNTLAPLSRRPYTVTTDIGAESSYVTTIKTRLSIDRKIYRMPVPSSGSNGPGEIEIK
jgi:hypothetical protein